MILAQALLIALPPSIYGMRDESFHNICLALRF